MNVAYNHSKIVDIILVMFIQYLIRKSKKNYILAAAHKTGGSM